MRVISYKYFLILIFNFSVYQNVIQINHAVYIYVLLKCAINIKLKSNKSVDKIEKHDLIFKLIISSVK